MLQIYNKTTCPKWIRTNCEKGHERNGIRYTCYFKDPKNTNTQESREVLFYIAYSEIDLETMLDIVKKLEFDKKHLSWSSRFGKHEPIKEPIEWKNKFRAINWLQYLIIGFAFGVTILNIAVGLIKKIFIYLHK